MNGNELQTALRGLVEQAQTTGAKLSLTQIARVCDVSYGRLWRFMTKPDSNIMPLDEAQRIYETLSGKPLLPNSNAL